MKLGHIDYMNCYPFFHHMFEKKPVPGVRVISDYPSVLNRMMVDSDLDMSAISAAVCAQLEGDIVLLPQFCLSSVGWVGSVILVSKVPIEQLSQKKVALTSASDTSVVLLKTLLKKYFHVEPEYMTAPPMPELEGIHAALMIGNEAMIYKPDPDLRVYDLGEIWLRETGFPVVFAVFAVRKSIIRKYSSEIRAVVGSFHQSMLCLEKEKESLISKAHERYSDIEYDIDRYFSGLEFGFTDDLKRAL